MDKWKNHVKEKVGQGLSQFKSAKTKVIREMLNDDVKQAQSHSGPLCVPHMSETTQLLPYVRSDEEREFILRTVVDVETQKQLENRGVLNWCRSAVKLYPLKTKADGNCLLHAASMAMWGIDDSELVLRRLLHVSVAQQESLYQRWKVKRTMRCPASATYTPETMDLENEWEQVKEAASDSSLRPTQGLQYPCLEDVHVFQLANILRRPIILLGDPFIRSFTGAVLEPDHITGIYLPLLHPYRQTYPYPVVLAYYMNHFMPLVAEEADPKAPSSGSWVKQACPLMMKDLQHLQLQFVLQEEEAAASRLLDQYLHQSVLVQTTQTDIKTINAATLRPEKVPGEFDVIAEYYESVQRVLRECKEQELANYSTQTMQRAMMMSSKPAHSESKFNATERCKTKGCVFFGGDATQGYCSGCYKKLSESRKIDNRLVTQCHPHMPPGWENPCTLSPTREELSLSRYNERERLSIECTEAERRLQQMGLEQLASSVSRVNNLSPEGATSNASTGESHIYDRTEYFSQFGKNDKERKSNAEIMQTSQSAGQGSSHGDQTQSGGDSFLEQAMLSQKARMDELGGSPTSQTLLSQKVRMDELSGSSRSQALLSQKARLDELGGSSRCQVEETRLSASSETSARENLGIKKCTFQECPNQGEPVHNGLCKDCFWSLKVMSVAKNAVISQPQNMAPVPVPAAAVSRQVVPEQKYSIRAAICRNRDCDRYGEKTFDGYCSKCYGQLYSRLTHRGQQRSTETYSFDYKSQTGSRTPQEHHH